MTRSLLSGGLMAGALTGLVLALLQYFLIQPLIVEAERYESGDLVLLGTVPEVPVPETDAAVVAPADVATDHEADGAQDTVMRNLLTVLFLILTWCGFGLLAGAGLTAFRSLPGGQGASGLAVALAGFAATTMAPALGLPPVMPGMQSAALEGRQLWWAATAGMTLGGLFLAAGFRSWPLRLVGLALILAPQLFGAPPPPASAPTVPPYLAALYGARVIGVSLIGWLVLSALLTRLVPETPGRDALRGGLPTNGIAD